MKRTHGLVMPQAAMQVQALRCLKSLKREGCTEIAVWHLLGQHWSVNDDTCCHVQRVGILIGGIRWTSYSHQDRS